MCHAAGVQSAGRGLGSPRRVRSNGLFETDSGSPGLGLCVIRLFVCVLFSVIVSLASADRCGGNCPSNDCPAGKCMCGTSPNHVDTTSWCSKFTGWSQGCCKCIAEHESGGNANAENYNPGGGTYDIGLWQINNANWGKGSCPAGAPCDPNRNLACAKQVWSWGGDTWRLWSTCSVCGCCNKK